MDENIIKDIQNNMTAKKIDELLDIWKENDRNEWSDEAFEAIKRVLIEKKVELPAQKNNFEEVKVDKAIIKCPRCYSQNIRKKPSWFSATFYTILFVVVMIFGQTMVTVDTHDRIAAGAIALAVVLFLPAIYFPAKKIFGSNKCLSCNYTWK